MDDSRIPCKTAPFSFENGLVRTEPKWGHQLVEQAINTSSGNGGDAITLIIDIAVIVEDQ